jgi:hypothetical protein
LGQKKGKPIANFFDLQGRFKAVEEKLPQEFKKDIDYEWKWLKRFMVV